MAGISPRTRRISTRIPTSWIDPAPGLVSSCNRNVAPRDRRVCVGRFRYGFIGGATAHIGPVAGAVAGAVGFSLLFTLFPLGLFIIGLVTGLAQHDPNVWQGTWKNVLEIMQFLNTKRD